MPESFEQALLRIARLPVSRAVSLQEALGWVAATASRMLQVERVGIWYLNEARDTLELADLFIASQDTHRRGATLRACDFPRYFAAITQARALVADDARTHSATSEFADGYLREHGIGAMLDVPMFHGGELVGIVCHEHVGGPRSWTTEQVRFAASVGDLAAFVREQYELARAQERLRAQEQRLQQAVRMEALGRLAAGVAHDFNNLLTGIVGCTDAALSATDDAGVTRHLDKVLAFAEQAAALTRQLLAFSRAQPLAPVEIDLGDAVRGIDRMLRPLMREGCRIEYRLCADPLRVRVDTTQLAQVVLNLAINARDAMPGGGVITIATQTVISSGRGIAVAGRDGELPAGRWACLSIADTGGGISDEVRDHLFEPFVTTKRAGGGTGLGLSTAWGVVCQSGGAIGVDTAPGTGTTFRVYLPLVQSGLREARPG